MHPRGQTTGTPTTSPAHLPVSLDEEHFPDEGLRQAVRDAFDTDGDGTLSAQEIADATSLNAAHDGITDATGIQCLTNLTELYLWGNQLTEADLTGLTNLTKLNLDNNQLTAVNLTGLTNLTWLSLDDNRLAEVDLTGLTNLTRLYLQSNQLTEVNLTGLTNLTKLNLSDNQLTEVDLTDCVNHVDVTVDEGVTVIGNDGK